MAERLRGRAGVQQRKRDRAKWPLCVRCLAKGITTATTEINHKIPLALGGIDTDENKEGLCTPCHKIVTAEQFGHRAPIEGRGVDRNGRPTGANHPWNRALTHLRNEKGPCKHDPLYSLSS